MSETRLIILYEEVSSGRVITLSEEDKRYLFKVLRLKPGDPLTVGDGKGNRFIAKIANTEKIEVLDKLADYDNQFKLILCQALLKGEKNELIVEKATELGVKKIIPFVSERCVRRDTNKIERWRKIAKEASEQSRRSTVPEISQIIDFKELIEKVDNAILFWEKEKEGLLKKLSQLDMDRDICFIIGPEGGFSEEEVFKAKDKGIHTASLGSRPLRAETAAVAATAVLSFLIENYDIIKK